MKDANAQLVPSHDTVRNGDARSGGRFIRTGGNCDVVADRAAVSECEKRDRAGIRVCNEPIATAEGGCAIAQPAVDDNTYARAVDVDTRSTFRKSRIVCNQIGGQRATHDAETLRAPAHISVRDE